MEKNTIGKEQSYDPPTPVFPVKHCVLESQNIITASFIDVYSMYKKLQYSKNYIALGLPKDFMTKLSTSLSEL